ncbi:MAG: hypothetical protein E6J90_13275 [Deltaproteobacteria bacterium]|nr:MAG: hypothetical protein E6J90_13275 [Deltaproteobacteria bacterium]
MEPRRDLRPQVASRSKWSRIEALLRNRTFIGDLAHRDRVRAHAQRVLRAVHRGLPTWMLSRGDGLQSRGGLHSGAMQPVKAVVKNGRLMVDEPTELPDGTEIELLPVDDDLDPQQRARLLQAIDEGIEDFERGDHMDGFDFIAQMRSRREAANR